MARAFQFKLEVVRTLRQQAQDAQRREVAEVLRANNRVNEEIELLTRQLRETVAQKRGQQRAVRIDLGSNRAHQYFRGRLHRQILEAHTRRSQCQEDLARERNNLLKATTQLKAIEKLREKLLQRHNLEIARQERVDADEMAIQAHLRGLSGFTLGGEAA